MAKLAEGVLLEWDEVKALYDFLSQTRHEGLLDAPLMHIKGSCRLFMNKRNEAEKRLAEKEKGGK